MTVATLIIKRALQKIGAASSVSEPDPSSVQTAFDALTGMIEDWNAQSIITDAVVPTVPGDDLGEKADTTNAFISNLSILVSPDFDNGKQIVSPALMRQAASQFVMIKAKYQTFTIPNKVVSSTLPVGQGNRRWRWDSAFFPEGSEIGN